MATVSNARVDDPEPDSPLSLSIPLQSIPFPAAIVNPEGAIVAVNADWTAACPKALCGVTGFAWCPEIPSPAAESLPDAIQSVLSGLRQRYATAAVTVSACEGGALLLLQSAAMDRDPAESGSAWQSYKMETVGRLLGGVAHDFANMLTLIAGHSDLVLGKIGNKDPIRPELEEIRKAASRGARLTGQLLGFSRGQTSQPRPLDLNLLIAEMQRMLRPIIGENVELQSALSVNLGRVMGDSAQVEQVLMNLILNARDAMPNGGRIRIETINCELSETAAQSHGITPGPYVLLSISDTGHGISQESMDQVFEPFYTTKDKGKGTGLGLSTVRSIVRQSGGDVWISSLPGESACFTICLPRVQEMAASMESAPQMPVAKGWETVLLVEDEEDVRRLLAHVLSKRGYQVIEASNGVEALRIFEQQSSQIHLVLTDMVMPRMGGKELSECVRRISPDMRVVFMSGYTDDVLIRNGSLGPGMTFLQKPLRPDALVAQVREALDSPSRPFNPQ